MASIAAARGHIARRGVVEAAMPETIVSLVPNVSDLLALDVEDLGGVVFEVSPSLLQNGMVHVEAIATSPFPQLGPSYPHGTRQAVGNAIAEALAWLEVQGLIFEDPGNVRGWYRISRRGAGVQSRAGVAAYKAAHVLPSDLMHPALPNGTVRANNGSSPPPAEIRRVRFRAVWSAELANVRLWRGRERGKSTHVSRSLRPLLSSARPALSDPGEP
jgi:hypothetical protein